MNRLTRPAALIAGVLLAALAGPAPAASAAGSHALIQGSGSSWAANAVNQWVADVASQGMQVVFTANGSAQGRKDYANRSTDFGVSDVGFLGKDPTTGQADTSLGRSFAYLPIAAGGTALPYHIDVGTTRVRNLRLSGETLAKIFTGQITNWNDAAVTRDNNGHALPSLPIIPVVHAEGAGVTMQFTRYLAKQYPSIWAPCNGGQAVETEYFPVNCGHPTGNMRAQAGSDGVMNFIKSSGANGSIGLEEYSYPLLANFPSVKVLNKAGYFTLPTQYNVAVALTKAVINEDASSPDYLLQNLDNVYTNSDRRTYPLSSYVYAIIPTASDDNRMTTAKRQTIADFLYYSICQGQQEIGPIGYSSLPINLVQAGFEQIGKLKTADAGVDLAERNVSTCHNPTFIAGKPQVNHLAVIAPQPPSCDKVGAGPCDASQGTYNENPGGGNSGSGSGTGSGSGSGSGNGTGSGSGSGDGSGSGSGSGAGTGAGSGAGGLGTGLGGAGAGLGGVGSAGTGADAGSGAGGGQVLVVPTTLAADSENGSSGVLAALAGGIFLAVLGVPVFLARRRPRESGQPS
ncbi:MAG: phosphate transport system substrate-binding protein [Pseudonocardiales bacterium]|nr:phosphate transport system substrate-binding protein [Pseudonocardiales bacterium]